VCFCSCHNPTGDVRLSDYRQRQAAGYFSFRSSYRSVDIS